MGRVRPDQRPPRLNRRYPTRAYSSAQRSGEFIPVAEPAGFIVPIGMWVVDEIESKADILARLRELGVLIALDDFGTRYCSLSYLRRIRAADFEHRLGVVRDAMAT